MVTPQAIINIDLSTPPANAQVIGAVANDHLSGNGTPNTFTDSTRARAIATGDFNNDGTQDVVIGAPDADVTVGAATREDAGAVYVIFGRPQPFPALIDTLTPAPNVRIFGAAAGDRLGFAVAVGDVNGDSIDDLIMGAPGADFPGIAATPRPNPIANTGAVFILLGAGNQTNRTIDLAVANSADVLFYGVAEGDQFGSSLAVANVGGIPTLPPAEQNIGDLIIGAPGSQGPDPTSNARPNGGAVFTVFGRPSLNRVGGATQPIDLGNTPPNVVIYGRTGDSLGSAVAAGDIDADGVIDLIVGAPNSDRPALTTLIPEAADTGATYVFYGAANLQPSAGTTRIFDVSSSTASQRPTITIYGADADDHSGFSITAADLTNDGTIDLVIGAPDADGPGAPNPPRANAGEVYLLSGGSAFDPPTATTERRLDLASPGAFLRLTVLGAVAGDRLGATVATGNFAVPGNVDAIRDLLLGAPGFDQATRTNAGAVSIFFGGPNLTFTPIRDLAVGQDDVRVVGEAAGDELGWAIATADVDQNRGGDLIVGAPFADFNSTAGDRPDAGKVYILLAANEIIPPVNQNPVVQVTAPNGGETLFGGTVFNIAWTASDANGDNTITRFEVRLSTDGGTSFNSIINENVPGNVRTLAWNVPSGLNTNNARIRVIAFDSAGGQGQDDSNANFTITDPGVSVTLLTPNGGETLRPGQAYSITWQVPPAVEAQVRGFDLYLSTDGGANFNIIILADPINPRIGPGVRTFNWTVPSNICTLTARVLIQATSLTGTRSSDMSDANFVIANPGPTVNVSNMRIEQDNIELRTNQPAVGDEVRFQSGIRFELSTDATGTTFFEPNKVKLKKSGRRLLTKGSFNGQEVGTFFPNGATRIIRLTNPSCGITLLRVTRNGEQLTITPPPASEEQPLP